MFMKNDWGGQEELSLISGLPLIILVILLRKMDLHDPNGNSQIITHFVNCSSS